MMTKEEAIKILKAISVYECYPKSASEETNEALDMAIEALQFTKHFDLLKEFQSLQEVVRCKGCRYSRVYQTDSKGTMQTNCVAFIMPRTVTDDGFCSWGEIKRNE